MKTAIITGINGQDGCYLAKLLIQNNYRVVGTTRSYMNTKFKNLEYLDIQNEVIIEEVDMLDVFSIIKLLDKYQPAEFYNLAAQSSVGLSFQQPIGTINYNTTSVLNILECIRVVNPKIKFYQASSSEMFGRVEHLPIKEDYPLHPLSPYAISKATAYWTVINYRESYKLFACNGILFNHESYLRSSNFFVKKVLRESLDIKYGNRNCIKVGNVMIKRDFGYSPEYVKAMWKLLQHQTSEDIIISSGKSIMLLDIIHHVFDALKLDKSKIIIDQDLFRPTEIEDIYGDNSKAKRLIGWNYDLDFFNVLDILIEEEERNYQA